ncbi:hypothetical protein [Mucilaginibacter ginsenosidivorax]|uniref:PorT family protein n=1 Tax=Mucilaginibacter ginsenosidivorax TaxID=862126 RepID=A0A5B8VY73_9SPHI|nr:hypothetical protein [Mucilaginibacter ginsenosidivorax]QEC76354.1 hypothetical protein FSB76_10500 [Mucilaginibacter ginsenosidivorax]
MLKMYKYVVILVLTAAPLFSRAQTDTSKNINGQDRDTPVPSSRFISFRNAKFSVGAGIEGAFPAMMKSTVNPSELSITYKDTRPDHSKYPYVSGGVALDIYSNNSLAGLLVGVNYSVSTTTYQQDKVATDYFSINRLEVPIYLKFRPGRVDATNHLWLLFGGIFSLPVSVNRQYITASSATPDGATFTDTNISQVSNLFLVSGSVGYEGYVMKRTRAAVFLSAAYSVNSQFNRDYIEYNPAVAQGPNGITTGGQSVLANFPNYSAHELRFTLGLKIFIKLKKHILKDAEDI